MCKVVCYLLPKQLSSTVLQTKLLRPSIAKWQWGGIGPYVCFVP